MTVNSKEFLNYLAKFNRSVEEVLYVANGNCRDSDELDSDIRYENTPEDLFLQDQYRSLLDRLDDIKSDITFLNRPIKAVGRLRENYANRFELIDDSGQVLHTYSTGVGIEALIYDKNYERFTWVKSRVEASNGRYYIFGYSKIDMEGLTARIRYLD